MPILDIEVVTRPGERLADGLASALADALGEAFGAGQGRLWVRLRELPAQRYAENGAGGDRFHPVFVTVGEGTPPEGEALASRVARIAECVARITGRPADTVHVILEPALRGRIAFGGKLST